MTKRNLFAAACVLVAALAAADNSRPVFPNVTFADPEGNVIELKSFQGAVVLLNFWASWCGPCRIELPELQKLYGELGRKGFVVLAVAVDTPVSKVRPFMDRLGLTMPALVMDRRAQEALGIDRIPFSVLLDQEGRVVQIYAGYSPDVVEDIRRRAEALLAAKAQTQGGK